MRAPAHRPFVLIQTLDQWRRCAHLQTNLDPRLGAVELAAQPTAPASESLPVSSPQAAGLAFDRHCRLYRTDPEAGQVFVHRWSTTGANLRDVLDPVPADREGRRLFASPPQGLYGDFVQAGADPGPLRGPSGIVAGSLDRLFVWEADTGCLLVWDLERREIRQRTALGLPGPVDLVWVGERLLGAGPDLPGMLERRADGHIRLQAWPAAVDGVPSRLAGDSRGRVVVLVDAGTPNARVILPAGVGEPIAVPGASDLEFLAPVQLAGGSWGERLVVARGPGEAFRMFILAASGMSEDEPLAARGYDGRGITRTPDDRIVFFGARGLRHALTAPVRYVKRGRVVGFRLDAGEFQTRWGRIFLDACVPTGTELRIETLVTDDPADLDPAGLPLERTPPANAGTFDMVDAGEPPMPPASHVPATIEGRLVARSVGRELPWTIRDAHARKHFTTWEGVVHPGTATERTPGLGRYLWVFLELRGDGRRTPKVRSIRVERHGHNHLARLPRVFARDAVAADFLWRFMAMFDGALADLEIKTVLRHALFHPQSCPEPFLPWLAGMLGLVLDARWPEPARRQAIAEANWLFRFRGTVPGLRRFLELYLGEGTVVLVEHFRMRGLEGTFTRHAHRFTVVVVASLSREQREVIDHILEDHRPAHTLVDVCTVDAGLRVGVGLHVGLSSIVGAGAGWTPLQLGTTVLGQDGIVGRPRPGTTLGGTRLGKDSKVG